MIRVVVAPFGLTLNRQYQLGEAEQMRTLPKAPDSYSVRLASWIAGSPQFGKSREMDPKLNKEHEHVFLWVRYLPKRAMDQFPSQDNVHGLLEAFKVFGDPIICLKIRFVGVPAPAGGEGECGGPITDPKNGP